MADFDPYHKWLGIPREEQPANYYRLLGVAAFESDAEVIANAVDRRTAHLKQFVSGPNEAFARQILGEVSTAKLCLLQPATKARYDQSLHARMPPQPVSAGMAPPTSPPMAIPLPAGQPPVRRAAAAAPEADLVVAAPVAEPVDVDPFDFTGGGDRISPNAAASASGIQRGGNRNAASKNAPAKKTTAKPQGTNFGTLYMVVICTVAVTLLGVYFGLKSFLGDNKQEAKVPETRVEPKEPPKKIEDAGKSNGVIKPQPKREIPIEKPPEKKIETPRDPSVNLLATVDIARNSAQGEAWGRQGETLISAPRNLCKLDIPYAAPAEYDLTIRGTRKQNLGEVAINLPTVARTVTADLDIGSGTRSWFGHTSAAILNDSRATVFDLMLPTDQPFTITAKVRKDAIGLIVNNRLRLSYVGDLSKLDTFLKWKTQGGGLAIGTFGCSIQIDEMKLLPATGPIPEIAALPPLSTSPPDKPKTPPKNPDDLASNNPPIKPDPIKPLMPATPEKKPAPTKEALEEAQNTIRDLFKEDFAKAKKPDEKFALAKKIFDKGMETRDDSTSHYAALWMAADMVAHLGDWLAVMETVNKLDEEYQMNVWETNVNFLELRSEPVNGQCGANSIDPLFRGVEAAVNANDFRLATRIMTLALKAARKAADKDITQKVQSRAKEIDSLAKQFDAIKADLDTLKQEPGNAAAITNVGRWYCFAQGDWDKGLPLLAKSEDADLKKLAAADLAHPADAEKVVQVADAWWDRSDAETDTLAKNRIQQHAADLYRAITSNLSGLAKAKAEKRIGEIDKQSEGRSGYIMVTRLEPTSKQARGDLMGLNRIPPGADAKTPPGFTGERACTDFIYAHARSVLAYEIPDGSKEFRATGYAPNRNVKFVVQVDGKRLVESAPANATTIKVELPPRAKKLELICEVVSGDAKTAESFWCYPRLYK